MVKQFFDELFGGTKSMEKSVSFDHNNRNESRKNHKKKYKMDLGSKSFGDFTKAIVSLD